MPKTILMMAKNIEGAAASPAYQGSTSGSGGERNGHPSQSSHPHDAPHGADRKRGGGDFKLRKKTRIATWNVRTLLQPGNLDLLLREMDRCKVQILGISEMRWSGKGHFTSKHGHTIYYSGKENSGHNGVALIANNVISNHVMGYNPVNDRIITIRLQATPLNISLVQVYAPTSTASDEDIESFYNQLQDVLDSLPNKDFTIVMGDFNAKVGSGIQLDNERKVIGQYGLGTRNERGNALLDFCAGNSLIVANTLFKQHPRRLYTWQSPGNRVRNQIDYILVKSRWRSSIKIAKTLPGADIGSDHQLLITDLRLKLKKVKRHDIIKRYDLTHLNDQYKLEVSNSFSVLMTNEEEMTPDELWDSMKDTISQAAKKHIPTKKKKRGTSWLSQDVIDLADERRELKKAGLHPSNLYRKLSNEIQQLARRDKNNHLKHLCAEIENHRSENNSRSLYRCVKDLTGTKTPRLAAVKAEDGKILTESDEIKNRWKNYCEGLYASQEPVSPRPVISAPDEEPDVLLSEVENAVHKMKINKSPGVDDIPSELLKCMDDNGITLLHKLCNKIWHTKTWPTEWKKSVFLTLPKKGDISQCKNNRTIALIPHASKVLLCIINERLRPHLERELPPEQAGFRRGRGTRDHIANIRHIIEKCKEFNRKASLCFIDYSKAFDCVRYSALWNALLALGIPAHLVELIQNLYNGQLACVRTVAGDSDWFSLGQGVRQGCILSPTLFNLYAEYIMRRVLDSHVGGVSIGGWHLSNLRYADDTTLITPSLEELCDLLLKVKHESEALGLHLNVAKTKIMMIGEDTQTDPIIIENEEVEVVTKFNFLGAYISHSGGCQDEIRRRLALGRSAMDKLHKIWADRGVTKATKIKLVQTLIFPIASYASESWTINKADLNRINAFEMWCWRRMLKIPWTAKRSNDSILQEIDQKRLLARINQQTLNYFGHISRRQGNCLEKVILQGKIEGYRRPGRPKSRYIDRIKNLVGQPLPAVYSSAADRHKWRAIQRITSCQT